MSGNVNIPGEVIKYAQRLRTRIIVGGIAVLAVLGFWAIVFIYY